MGDPYIDEMQIPQAGTRPTEELLGETDTSQAILSEEDRLLLEGIVRDFGSSPGTASPPGTVPTSRAGTPGQLATETGRDVIAGTAGEPVDPLGIRGASGNVPTETMSPGRQALARAVQGWGEKGSATIGAAAQQGKEAIDDFPKTWEEFVNKVQKPENMRGILRGSGGAAGGMIGTPGGPGGIAAGTFVGSMVGGYLANAYEDITNWAKASGASPDQAKRLFQPTLDALQDTGISGSVSALPYATPYVRQLMGRMLSLPPNSRQIVEEAASLGVDIGVANVANGGVGKGAVNVFGRMPLIGTSARKASEKQGKQIVEAYNDMFGQVANPSATTEVSEAALLAARQKFGEFAVKSQKRYEHALRVGHEQGQIIPSDKVIQAADEVIQEMSTKTGRLLGVPPAQMRTFLSGVSKNLEDKMSTLDANNILIDLEGLLRKSNGAHGVHYQKLEKVRDAVLDTLRGSHPAGARLLLGAREAFQDGIKEFETSIYKKMVGEVDRSIYAIGKVKGGTMTAEDLMNTAAKTSSASAVRELRSAAGDDVVRNVARARLDDAWVKATGVQPGDFFVGQRFTFEAKKFSEALGLNNPNSHKYLAMKEMLRGSGTTLDDVAKLAQTAEAVTKAPIADASTFMARAAVLRGAGGVAEAVRGALTFGGTGKAARDIGWIPAIAGLVMMRHGIGAMMKPGLVRMATTAMDETVEPAARAAALTQMTLQYPSLFNE